MTTLFGILALLGSLAACGGSDDGRTVDAKATTTTTADDGTDDVGPTDDPPTSGTESEGTAGTEGTE